MTYDPKSQRARDQLAPDQRRDLDNGMQRIAQDPYGSGSSPTYSKDRREATCGSVFVVYQITNSRLLITVVQVIA
ncbi:hypothetical protein B4N89_26400 [Embleya scabrispora]|uniref:Addiction module toxin RelE n=1 Tax=Embleya scabrispora TaxID=159449 RepID=A0A1T3P4V2_9ACTN|nr:hypothetical protein B4N89_26400 [Embleya scabrispora]